MTVDGPTAARVAATFELAGSSAAALLLAELPGQTIEAVEIRIDGVPLPGAAEPRSSALRAYALPAPAAGRLEVSYRLEGSDPARFRYALPVPEATPTGDTDVVRLVVTLPDGADFAGNVFPPMEPGEAGLEASLAAVPAVVHVVFGARRAPSSIGTVCSRSRRWAWPPCCSWRGGGGTRGAAAPWRRVHERRLRLELLGLLHPRRRLVRGVLRLGLVGEPGRASWLTPPGSSSSCWPSTAP